MFFLWLMPCRIDKYDLFDFKGDSDLLTLIPIQFDGSWSYPVADWLEGNSLKVCVKFRIT